MNKRIIIWISNIDNLILNDENGVMLGGIQVQMYMWSVTFAKKGWKVISFTKKKINNKIKLNNINFMFYPTFQFLNPISSILFSVFTILKQKPHLIFITSATRDLFFISLIAKLLKIKLIFRFASNSDLEPGKEIILRYYDKILFRTGLRLTKNLIIQNKLQAELLNKNYNKSDYLLIPNIWTEYVKGKANKKEKNIILWVSNFKNLKRPTWFIKLAEDKPYYKFVMVGFPYNKNLYNFCKNKSDEIKNLTLIGGLSFSQTNELFKQARLFVCTSEIEGFPNTFLQAWMNECPVITTYDPSDIVKNYQLGSFCPNYEKISLAVDKFADDNFIKSVQKNIKVYFKKAHSAEIHYDRLINKFKVI